MAKQEAGARKRRPAGGEASSGREIQEELAFLRQKANSLSMRGEYAACVKLIEENIERLYFQERWPENFHTVLRLHQKCYPALQRKEPYQDYLTALLKRHRIPHVFANLLRGGDTSIVWSADYFRDLASVSGAAGDYETALGYADIAVKIEPGSVKPYLMKAMLRDEMGEEREAVELYERVLEMNPGNRYALNHLSRHYMKSSPKKAREYIEAAIAQQPDEASYYATKSAILQRAGDLDGAVSAIEQAVALDSQNPAYFYDKGELYLQQGKVSTAVNQFRLAAALNPKHLPSLKRLIEFTRETQPDLALTYANTVVSLEPEDRRAMLVRAQLQQRLGENAAAIDQYTRLLKLDPTCHEALGGLGTLYLIGKKPDKAVDCLKRAIALDKNVAGYHLDKARAHKKLGQVQEAAAAYKSAVALDKKLTRAWSELGDLYRKTDPAAAVEYYTKAIELDPANVYYRTAKGDLLAAMPDRRQDAIDCYNEACKLEGADAALHFKLGVLLEEAGSNASAVEHFRLSIGRDPQNAASYYHMARLYVDTQPDMALAYINSAIALDALGHEYYYFKGKTIFLLGRNAQAMQDATITAFRPGDEGINSELGQILTGQSNLVALQYLNRAVELAPDNTVYHCTRAHLLYDMGQKSKAQALYQKLLAQDPRQHGALYGMGRVLADRDDDAALGYLDKAVALAPADAEYRAARAEFLSRKDETYSRALEEYSAAIALNKQAWWVILEKAKLLDAHDDAQAAMAEYRRVLLVYPKSVEAAGRLGIMLSDLSPANALVYLNQALRLAPENWLYYVWRGKVLCALGREQEAAEDLNEAILRGGDTGDTCYTLAGVLREKAPAVALRYARLAVEKNADKVEYLLLAGKLFMELEDLASAKEMFQRAAALDSGCHEALENLALVALQERDPSCDEIASAAHSSCPECLTCTYVKARILDEIENDVPSAIEFMQRVVLLAPDEIRFREKLVELLEKKGGFLRLRVERRRLEKLRSKLAAVPAVEPAPAFDEEVRAKPDELLLAAIQGELGEKEAPGETAPEGEAVTEDDAGEQPGEETAGGDL